MDPNLETRDTVSVDIAKVVAKASAIDGWMMENELDWLARTANTHETIIEIGSWKGRSTKALALSTNGIVYAVDHWKGSESKRAESHREAFDMGPDRFFEIFGSNLRDEIKVGKVVPIRCESGDAVNLLRCLLMARGGKADMVFIDADHTYESVSRDIKNYTPLLALGGILSGHDYCVGYPDVMRAVHELVPGWTIGSGSIWQRCEVP